VIVCDTGPLVAAALANDDDHHACVELMTGLHLAGRQILVPAPVVAEVGYLLARESTAAVESAFLRSLADGDFVPVDLTAADYARMAELVTQYADLGLGTTDAAVVAVSERLNIAEVATLDRRHFTVVRPRHVQALTLLP
jgi:predicted nucleic acid-binding protein